MEAARGNLVVLSESSITECRMTVACFTDSTSTCKQMSMTTAASTVLPI